jgi:hypothetical protein
VDTWNEWIEPLTVYGRHPFFFAGWCIGERHVKYYRELYKKRIPDMQFPTDLLHVDYMLLKRYLHPIKPTSPILYLPIKPTISI